MTIGEDGMEVTKDPDLPSEYPGLVRTGGVGGAVPNAMDGTGFGGMGLAG